MVYAFQPTKIKIWKSTGNKSFTIIFSKSRVLETKHSQSNLIYLILFDRNIWWNSIDFAISPTRQQQIQFNQSISNNYQHMTSVKRPVFEIKSAWYLSSQVILSYEIIMNKHDTWTSMNKHGTGFARFNHIVMFLAFWIIRLQRVHWKV